MKDSKAVTTREGVKFEGRYREPCKGTGRGKAGRVVTAHGVRKPREPMANDSTGLGRGVRGVVEA